jgi:hypothetical protein
MAYYTPIPGLTVPKPKVKPPRPVVRAAPPPGTTVGRSAAQQMIDTLMAPVLADLKTQGVTLSGNQADQRTQLAGFTKELIGYLKGTPAAITGDYRHAVNETDRLAQQSAAAYRSANPNAQIQADLRSIRAPAAQRAELVDLNRQAYGTGAARLYQSGGAIPATMFAQDQAAASAFARSLPAIQALSGTQAFRQLLSAQAGDTANLAGQRAAATAKVPGLVLQAVGQFATAKAKAAAEAGRDARFYAGESNDMSRFNVSERNKAGRLEITQAAISGRTQATLAAKAAAATTAAEVLAATPDRTKSASFARAQLGAKGGKAYLYAKDGSLMLDAHRRPLTFHLAPTVAGGGKTVTATERSTTLKRADDAGDAAMEKLLQKVWSKAPEGGGYTEPGTDEYAKAQEWYQGQLPKSFNSAMTRVITAIGPHLRAIGYTPAQVKQRAYGIVSAQIDPPPGYTYKPPKHG